MSAMEDHGEIPSVENLNKKATILGNIRRYKIGKTVALVIVWACYGMIHALGSPTLPDFRDRLHTNMEDLTLAFGFRNFGALLGSVLFGMMADRYRKRCDLIMGVAVIVTGIPVIAKPHVGSLITLGALSFGGGMGQGGLEAVGTAMVQWMWGAQAGASFHALHMGYPIGTVLAPLIAMNFLSPDANTTAPEICGMNSSCPTTIIANATTPVSRIEIPFAIVGTLTCAVGCVFIVLMFCGTPKEFKYHGDAKTSFLEVFSPKSCRSVGSTFYTCGILCLVCILYVFLNAKDGALSTFVFAFAIESKLKFSKKEAALLDTTYRVTEIFGRALSVIMAHYLPIQPMIISCVYINAIFTACLAFLGSQHRVYLWVFACLFKFTAAPIWPSGFAWTARYLRFSSMVTATTQVVLGITGYGVDWLGGHLYDKDPALFMYYGMTCGFVLVVIITVMQIVASCCASERENLTRNEDQKNGDEEEGVQERLVHAKEA